MEIVLFSKCIALKKISLQCAVIKSLYISLSSGWAASADFPYSLTIHRYHPSLPAGLPDYILYPYRTTVGRFLLVSQHWHVHVKGSIREVTYKFVLASPAVSCKSWSFYLDGFRDGGKWPYRCFVGVLLFRFVEYSL